MAPGELAPGELALAFAGRPALAALRERILAGLSVEDPRDGVHAALARARAHERAGRMADAVREARSALEAAEALGWDVGIAGGLGHLAYAYYRLGDLGRADALAAEALAACRSSHDHLATARFVRGLCAHDRGDYAGAVGHFRAAEALSREVGYPLGLMLALLNLSMVYHRLGAFDRALVAAADSARLCDEIGVPTWSGPWTRAFIHRTTGDRARARAALAELQALDPPVGFAEGLRRMLTAQLALDEDDIATADALAADARAYADRLGNPVVSCMVRLVMARLRRVQGDAAAARAWVDEAIVEVDRVGLVNFRPWLELERARVHWALGDVDAARAELEPVRARADAAGTALDGAEAALLLAGLAHATGSPEARPLWVDVEARVRAGGYGFLLERERALVLAALPTLARADGGALAGVAEALLEQLARAEPVPLTVTLLGHFAVRQGRRDIDAREWRRRRAGELFRYLLTRPDRRAVRDLVLDALWPDQPATAAAAQLHQATSALRRLLEPDLPEKFPSRYVRVEGDVLVLHFPAGSTVDTECFAEAAHRALASGDPGDLTGALGAYSGEPLAEDRYADWATPDRERLAELATRTRLRLARAHLAAGELTSAHDLAVEVLGPDPTREEAAAVAMEALVRAGQRARAARLYRTVEAALRDDFGMRPGPELRAIAEHLRD